MNIFAVLSGQTLTPVQADSPRDAAAIALWESFLKHGDAPLAGTIGGELVVSQQGNKHPDIVSLETAYRLCEQQHPGEREQLGRYLARLGFDPARWTTEQPKPAPKPIARPLPKARPTPRKSKGRPRHKKYKVYTATRFAEFVAKDHWNAAARLFEKVFRGNNFVLPKDFACEVIAVCCEGDIDYWEPGEFRVYSVIEDFLGDARNLTLEWHTEKKVWRK